MGWADPAIKTPLKRVYTSAKRNGTCSVVVVSQNRRITRSRYVENQILAWPAGQGLKSVPGFWPPRIWKGCYPRPTRRATQPGAFVVKALRKQEKARLRAFMPLARRACAPPSTQTARQCPRAIVRRVRVCGKPGCCGTDPDHPNHPNHHPNHRRPPHPPQWRRRQPSGPLLLHIHSSRWCRCCTARVRRRTQLPGWKDADNPP